MFLLNIIQSPTCDICKTSEEDLLHCIAFCQHAFILWLYVGQILSRFLNTNITVNLKTIILGLQEDIYNTNLQIANFCLAAARSAIWTVRNSIKFDNLSKNTKVTFKTTVIGRIKQEISLNQNAQTWATLQDFVYYMLFLYICCEQFNVVSFDVPKW